MVKKNSFVKDFARGNKGVEFVLDIFSKHGIDAKEDKEGGIKHDIIFTIPMICFENVWWEQTAEIKYDLYAKRSGNMAIEYHNSKKDKASGISATAADYWIHVFDKPAEAYIIYTKYLKEVIKKETPVRIVENAGDGNANLLLYKKEIFLKYFQKLEEFIHASTNSSCGLVR